MADRPWRLTSFEDYCRSNGPRVGQPESHNLSRHRGRLRPSRPQGEEPSPEESTARRPTARSRPSSRDDFQRSRLWGVGRRLQQIMTSSKGTGQRCGYSEAHSRPLPRAGMARARRTREDLRAAWHCCPAGPDISTTVPSPAPTTACLYGLEAVGPTSQRDLGRRRENRQLDPSGVGPGESAKPSPRAHAPLIKMRWGVAIVIARHAAGLLPRPHD